MNLSPLHFLMKIFYICFLCLSFKNMIYLISAETPIFFVPILLQIYLNLCPTPGFWTDYECAVLKVNALINFETFFRRSLCSKEERINLIIIFIMLNIRGINKWKITRSASIGRFASCHARKIAKLRTFMVDKVKGFISVPNVRFY